MANEIHLLLHNIGFIFSAVMSVTMAFVIYLKDHKPLANKALIGTFIAGAVFSVFHLIGVNAADPVFSRSMLVFTSSSMYMEFFITLSIFASIGLLKQERRNLLYIFICDVLLTLYFLVFPGSFLNPSLPKMYFPNYYEAGNLYWVLITWNMLVGIYFIYHLIRAFPPLDPVQKNRIKYFAAGYLIGFSSGSMAYFLVLNIPVDPVWSIFMLPSFAAFLSYAILKYDLLDIRVIAKSALIYATIVALVGLIIVTFNYLNNYLISQIPDFPVWLLPIISSLIAISLGVLVREKVYQGELLKYEFITVVTHKFRTPLTHIKWAAENLLQRTLNDENRNDIQHIQSANGKLVELTNLLMNVSETQKTAFDYEMVANNLGLAAEDIAAALKVQFEARDQKLIRAIEPDCVAVFDQSRIRFIIQVLMENAISYTPVGGTITMSVRKTDKETIFSVKDSGIGIPKEEIPLLFSKFYRGSQAKLTDSEGMGIGLYISKEVIARHHGRLWAESEGYNKGSTFSFSLPLE